MLGTLTKKINKRDKTFGTTRNVWMEEVWDVVMCGCVCGVDNVRRVSALGLVTDSRRTRTPQILSHTHKSCEGYDHSSPKLS